MQFISKLLSFVLIGLVFMITYDAFMRYFLSSGSIALQELEWHLYDLIILISIPYTLKLNEHVKVDIFYEHFSVKYQSLIDIFAYLVFVVPFSAMILYFSYDFVMLSYMQNEASSDPGGLSHRFIIKSAILIAFSLLILQTIQNIKQSYKIYKGAK